MKKIYLQAFAFCCFYLVFIHHSFAIDPAAWSHKLESQKTFIENKGQFTIKATKDFDPQVRYAYDGDISNFYFTTSGVVYELVNIKKPKEKENEAREMKEHMKKGMTAAEHTKMEAEENRVIIKKDELRALWVGANPNVQIIAEEKKSAYHSYSFMGKGGKLIHVSDIPAFGKLTYKDLYPNIDVVYEMHPQDGIKYSVIVHPGGDISQVKLHYSKSAHLRSDGTIRTNSRFGNFIDHAPATFYADDKTPVASAYSVNGNVISFSVPGYDPARTVVIDPWTQSPTFNTQWHCAWECQKDAAGNVYMIGGVMPMQLLKYNSAGALQWTYNTPYDTSNCWLGTFAVDNAGNSYVTAGSVAQIEKVSTAGAVVWNNSTVTGIFGGTEFWSISFNCDQTQLVVGGTGGIAIALNPFIYNIDMTSGNVLNSLQVTGSGSAFGFPPIIQEVRAITACGNGNYYFLTHDSIGYVHQGLASCLPPGSSYPFHVSNSYGLGYKCENFRVNNTGIKAIKYFKGYVYTHRGNQVHKRNFNTGAIIATATIPGGAFTNSGFGGSYVSNSGIDIDSCGNVYVGSVNQVVKYDANLNLIGTFPTSSNFNVYDVTVSSAGNLIAAGSTGDANSGARSGYLQSWAAGTCPAIAIACCDASICPHAAVCASDAPFNLTSTTAGGVWSGTGITNATNGTFSPTVSGVGTFTVYYTLSCGRDSTVITVNSCSAVSLCRNANGSLTVSGGTAPYTWQTWDSIGRVCQGGIVFGGLCIGGTWVNTYGWRTFTSGAATTVTPPAGTDTLRVIDNAGTTVTSYNIANLPPCVSCAMTVSAGTTRNVSCFGAANGFARVTVSGGTAPYTYTWSPNVSNKDSATGLVPGTYTVTVQDNNNCTGSATFTITQPAVLSVTKTVTQPICSNTGKIKLTVTGGTSGYTYTWSPNVSTVDSAINLAAGTYNVTVTDSRGCVATTSQVINTPIGITVTTGVITNVSCLGGNNGTAHINASGGTPPFTYTWSPNVSTTDSAINLTAGTYSVTVADRNSCSGSVTFTITQPVTGVVVTKAVTQPTCGNNNGKIKLTVSGGTPGYTYTWSPNVSTVDSAINLAAGTYNITVTDSRGCIATVTQVLAPPAGITVTNGATTNVNCFGGNNGKAHVTVTGGTTPYTYTWSPNVSTNDSAINLTAGTYTVTVRDQNNCSGSATFIITQPIAALSITKAVTQPTCGNNNGKIILTVSGGTPGYTYTWSPNVSTVDSAINLGANTYNVTVTDSKGCVATATQTINPSTNITVAAGATTNVSCFGGNNGKAHVTVSGGTTPYSYTWSPNVSTNDSAVNLTAGTYTVTVRDQGNCSGSATFNITQPTALSVTKTFTPPTCNNNDGKIKLTVTGGTPGYTYTWSPNVSTVDSAINLAANTYNVTVTDSKGCVVTATQVLSPPAGIIVAAGATTNVSCFGGNNGKAHVTVSGGTTPYTYTWSPNVSTNDSAVNLTAGTYTVTVRDQNNCSGSATFTITQPVTALSVTKAVTQPTCNNNDGKIKLTVTGGTPGYTYTWSPNVSTVDSAVNLSANTYNVTVTDSKGCVATATQTLALPTGITVAAGATTNVSCFGGNNGKAHVTVSGGTTPYTYTWSPNVSTNDSAINLTAGTYTVTVRDQNNCSGSATFTITQPLAALAAVATAVPATCGNSDGKVRIVATGGTPVYSYTWSPAVSTVDSAINLAVGSYTVTVTDSKGCIVTISANVAASNGFSVSQGPKTNVNCFGGSTGSAHVNATGGTTPYTYTWSPNVSTNDSAINLAAGTYTVTVRDQSNCSGAATFIITQPTAGLTVTKTVVQGSCGNNNGKIVLTPAGGTPGYTYQWSPNVSTTDSAVNLSANTYNATVTDSKGCISTVSQAITVSPAISITAVATSNVLCLGGNNGSIHLTVTGGTGTRTYTWSPNVSSADSAINLTAGTYSVTVSDVNGCSAVTTTSITQPNALTTTMASGNADCGVSNGWAEVTAAGGTGGYTYVWNNPQTTDSITGLTGGVYRVTVTDGNGCQRADSVTVGTNSGPSTPTISGGPLTFCQGDSVVLTSSAATGITWSTSATTQSIVVYSSGTYTVTQTIGGCTASAGKTVTVNVLPTPSISVIAPCSGVDTLVATGGVSYEWNTGATTPRITTTTGGTYTVTATNAANCTASASVTVTQPNVLTTTMASGNADCGVPNGWAEVTASGGAGGYTYLWNNPQTTDSITGLAGGVYRVTVTDGSGCQKSDSVTVGTNAGPSAPTISGSPLAFCQGDSVVLTSSAATGNTWNTSATTQSITVTTSGTYSVTQTVGGCTSPAASVTVTVNPIPAAPTISAAGPLSFCQGSSVVLTSSAPSGNTWSNGATTQSTTVFTGGPVTVSTTQAGCTSAPSASVSVTIIPNPTPEIIADKPAICPGDTVRLDATTPGATAYSWSNSANQAIITSTTSGSYSVTVTVNGCVGNDDITIGALPVLGTLSLQDSAQSCAGDTITLDATTANATAYRWSSGIAAITPIVSIDSGGVYYVTVSNSCGSLTDSVVVFFESCDCKVAMGDAFTPNGDGKNEKFGPLFLCKTVKSMSMKIYNRWGQLIFQTEDINGQWDGTYKGVMQPDGAYIYMLDVLGEENHKDKTIKIQGTVTIIR